MNLIKGIIIAFSMFSKIPMPFVKWEEKNLQYMFCFFPFIGIVIGVLDIGWFEICEYLKLNRIVVASVATLIPIAVTGGIHFDGFMDTCDALSSHGDKQKMIEILDDSHIGAFAAINTILYFLIYFASMTCVENLYQMQMIMISFFAARAAAVCIILSADCLKESGLLYTFKSNTNKIITGTFTVAYIILSAAVLESLNAAVGMITVVLLLLSALCFVLFVVKKIGGISGDLIGYFICVCELLSVLAIGIGGVVL